MAGQAGITVKVETSRLISVSGEVETKIRNLENAFTSIENTVNASRGYWDGDGVASYVAAYRGKKDIVSEALQRFRANVNALREIAGVYEQNEQSVTTKNTALPSDLID